MIRLGWRRRTPSPTHFARHLQPRHGPPGPPALPAGAHLPIRAFEGWRLVAQQDEGGAIQLLLDKMQRNATLPSTSGSLRRAWAATAASMRSTPMCCRSWCSGHGADAGAAAPRQQCAAPAGPPGRGHPQHPACAADDRALRAAVSTLKPWPGVLQPQADAQDRDAAAKWRRRCALPATTQRSHLPDRHLAEPGPFAAELPPADETRCRCGT